MINFARKITQCEYLLFSFFSLDDFPHTPNSLISMSYTGL